MEFFLSLPLSERRRYASLTNSNAPYTPQKEADVVSRVRDRVACGNKQGGVAASRGKEREKRARRGEGQGTNLDGG